MLKPSQVPNGSTVQLLDGRIVVIANKDYITGKFDFREFGVTVTNVPISQIERIIERGPESNLSRKDKYLRNWIIHCRDYDGHRDIFYHYIHKAPGRKLTKRIKNAMEKAFQCCHCSKKKYVNMQYRR